MSKLGHFPDPYMGLHVLMSRHEIPLGSQSLFGFGFCSSPTHLTRQVLFLNIPFPKNWNKAYKVTNGNFQKCLDFVLRWWVWVRPPEAEVSGGGLLRQEGEALASCFNLAFQSCQRLRQELEQSALP